MSKYILIVDDDSGVRTVLGDLLEELGYRVSLVAGGAGMRHFLKYDRSVDAVIPDGLMPGEDSAKLAFHAKALRLPVVMISGSLERLEAAREHDLQLLGKPFRSSELVNALELALASGEFGQRDANGHADD
jgi:DNA-binding NtrC family response regulator